MFLCNLSLSLSVSLSYSHSVSFSLPLPGFPVETLIVNLRVLSRLIHCLIHCLPVISSLSLPFHRSFLLKSSSQSYLSLFLMNEFVSSFPCLPFLSRVPHFPLTWFWILTTTLSSSLILSCNRSLCLLDAMTCVSRNK